jgi:hypothetical protein
MNKPLRRAVDVSTVLAAVALVAIMGSHFSGQFKHDRQIAAVQDGLRQFDQVLSMRAATKDTSMTGKGFPTTIDPAWFTGSPPRNELVTSERPWLEICPATEASLKNPSVRVATDWHTAAFWYNPYLGIVRARVPYDISDERAKNLYNQVNGTSVASIYGLEAVLPEEQYMGPPAELATDPGIDPGPTTVSVPNE